MNREVGLGTRSAPLLPPVPNKPCGVCGRKAPRKTEAGKYVCSWGKTPKDHLGPRLQSSSGAPGRGRVEDNQLCQR